MRMLDKFVKRANGSFNVDVWHRKVGEANDVPIYDQTKLYSTVDDVQWSYNDDVYTHKTYLTITGTNYYLWIFKSTVFEFIYEMNTDIMPFDNMDNDKLPGIIRKLLDFTEHGLYTDTLYEATDSFGTFALIGSKERWILPVSEDEFRFIRTK